MTLAQRAASAKAEDDRDDFDDHGCWNCDGEGYVYGCSWDWQCDTWDGDSCLCSRRCEICNPVKPTAEQEVERKALGETLAAAVAQAKEL